MHPLTQAARQLDAASAAVDAAARALPEADPGAPALGATAPGRLGEVGRALHDRWLADTADRAREAALLAGSLAETAHAVRTSADAYGETDAASSRRTDHL